MASGKGHLVGGVVFLWIFLTVMANYFFVPDAIEIVIYAAIIILFSLWPDVDIKGLGQKVFYSIFFITDVNIMSPKNIVSEIINDLLNMFAL